MTEPDDTLYARDLDDTGSPHICSYEDPGARRYVRDDASVAERLRGTLADLDRAARHPTREEAALAAAILHRCNGLDLDVWTDQRWPDDTSEEALALLAADLFEDTPKGT